MPRPASNRTFWLYLAIEATSFSIGSARVSSVADTQTSVVTPTVTSIKYAKSLGRSLST